MKDYSLKKPISKNQLDDMTEGLVNAMRYSNPFIVYPEIENAKPNDGVEPEWFYPIYNGVNDFSELTAIHMYVGQETKFEEIGQLMLGIGMTEMKHFGKIGEFIRQIGGDIEQAFDSNYAELGADIKDALKKAQGAEERTIKFYDALLERLSSVNETTTVKTALELVSKLKADEQVHLELLIKQLQQCTSEN